MHRKRFHKKSSRKERIIENVISYSAMSIIVIILFILLSTFFRPDNIIIKEIKSDVQKVKSIVKKIEHGTQSIKKPKPEKPIVIKKIKRSEAYRRGMDIINYVWVYNVNLNGVKSNENIALPNYLIGIKQVKVSGLPYCWGGYTSLDISNSSDVKNFQDALKKGYTAGNVNCIGNYKSFTAGLDCSGFVCAVFKIPEKCGTGNISRYFNTININDLKPMDILDCVNKHVFIYLKETSDKKGIITMEAAYNKYSECSEKTKINYRSWDSIKKGVDGKPFIPMRYKGIVDDVVKSFKDSTEYNFGKEYATMIKINQEYKGYIDYVDDIDYFKLNIDKNTKYSLKVLKMPKFCNLVIVNSKEKVIFNARKRGLYNLKLTKDLYYIKVQGIDFKFNSDEDYLFKLQQPLKQAVFKLKSSHSTNIKANHTLH
jgi:hypothetical protein